MSELATGTDTIDRGIQPKPDYLMEYPLRVLLVDDYRPYSDAVRKTLTRRFGFHVTVVESGEDALSRFAHARPDLILIDMHLPGISGYDTLRSIRSLPNGDKIPAIVVSGFEDLEYVEAMAALGVKGYLEKDSALEELPQLLATIFPKHEALRSTGRSVD